MNKPRQWRRSAVVIVCLLAVLPGFAGAVTGQDLFESEVLKADLPVVVDFGADWCHPCKQLDPVVDELAEEWDGKV